MQVMADKLDIAFNSVLYATDFSRNSENAGRFAALLAQKLSLKLVVAHAFLLSQAAQEIETEKSRPSLQRSELQKLLQSVGNSLQPGTMQIETALVEGAPSAAIPILADRLSPAILVLGTHGGGMISRGFIGSAAEEILRSSKCPSLTVGPKVKPASSENFPFRRILFASDLSATAAHAAVYAMYFAQIFHAEIDILNVIKKEDMASQERIEAVRSHFLGALQNTLPNHASEFVDPQTFIDIGSVPKRIEDHIKNRAIDLLVLGVKKSSHIGLEMRTSRAFQIVVDAECPVLTVTG